MLSLTVFREWELEMVCYFCYNQKTLCLQNAFPQIRTKNHVLRLRYSYRFYCCIESDRRYILSAISKLAVIVYGVILKYSTWQTNTQYGTF